MVPPSGSFEWHVNPSTRPFEGEEKRVPGEISTTPARVEEFENEEEMRPSELPQEEGDDRPTFVDRQFTIAQDEATRRLRVALEWPGQTDDYDLSLHRRLEDGTLEEVDTSGNSLSLPEEIIVEADALKPGEYVVRVHNFLAQNQEWHARVERFEAGPDVVTPGVREAWTLTCEDGSGNVLETQEVFVDRGQGVSVDLACAAGGPGPDPDPDPNPSPGPGGRPNPSGPAGPAGSRDTSAPRFIGRVRVARGRVRYRLSEAATVTLRVQRRVGASARWGRGLLVTRSGLAGRNVQRLGRLARAGRYRLVAVVTDAAGNRSAARRSNRFLVKRR